MVVIRSVGRRVVHVSALVCVCLAAYGVQSCRSRSNDAAPSVGSGYHAIVVQNGGTITGVVAIDGAIPDVPRLEINHDNDACGTSHASPRLECGSAGGMKFAVVYLEDIKEGAKLDVPVKPIAITQRGCAYLPHVVVVPVGASIAVQNEDRNVLHNVHLLLGDTTIWNQAQPMFEQINTRALQRPGVMHLRCDAGHIWMSGYVWVTEHPYYAITDGDGNFTLHDVPPGTYSLVCWHEGWNATPQRSPSGQLLGYAYDAPHEVRRNVVVSAGQTAVENFSVPTH